MTVNVIICQLEHINALSQSTDDPYVYNVFINKNLPYDKQKKELKHEVGHILGDDFFSQQSVDLLETMIRHRDLTEEGMRHIDFYYHFAD